MMIHSKVTFENSPMEGNYLVVEHKILTKAGCENVINELRKALEE